jgi:hypothetical protein
LKNERSFDPASNVGYELGEPEGGIVPVTLSVYAKNSLNALVVPFPKYSRDDGFSLAVRYKDFNFLGTMRVFKLDFDYYFSGKKAAAAFDFSILSQMLGSEWTIATTGDMALTDGSLGRPNASASVSTSYPFSAFGLGWSFQPSVTYKYERDYSRHTATGKAGVGFDLPLGAASSPLSPLRVSTSIGYSAEFYADRTTQSVTNDIPLSTSVTLASLPFFGALTWAPSVRPYATTDLVRLAVSDAGMTVSQRLSVGRVDLDGNFRKGASLSLSQSDTWRFLPYSTTDSQAVNISLDATAFSSSRNIIGINARILGRWFYGWDAMGWPSAYDWEPAIRGREAAMYGDLGLIANIEAPINLAQGEFFGWSKLDSEVFFQPFLDVGVVRSSPSSGLLDKANRVLCGGFEFVVYPTLARAFTYRLSVGYDLADYLETRDFEASKLEIWLGLGLHF